MQLQISPISIVRPNSQILNLFGAFLMLCILRNNTYYLRRKISRNVICLTVKIIGVTSNFFQGVV